MPIACKWPLSEDLADGLALVQMSTVFMSTAILFLHLKNDKQDPSRLIVGYLLNSL